MIPLIDGPPTWHVDAACRGANQDIFFPERGESTAPAKAVCATCPVAAECLQYAVDELIKYGIWGGKSERERRTLRRLARKEVAA